MTSALGSLEVVSREARRVTVHRVTRETDVTVTVDLDGSGTADIRTGVGFYDHLLGSLAHHGLLDLVIRATVTSRSTTTTPSRMSRWFSAPPSRKRSATGRGSSASAMRACRWTRRSRPPSSMSADGRMP